MTSDITHYGLWQVNTLTGEISPSDLLAEEAAAFCGFPDEATFPGAVTPEQAELLVWISSYDCFETKPSADSFTAYQDNPQRWLVEGKETVTVQVEVESVTEGRTEIFVEERAEIAYYGLWMVDTSTATITPWDDLSREKAKDKDCYRTP